MICVEILPVAGRGWQEVTKEGSICIEKAQEDQGTVTHDRKSLKRGGSSTSFDCMSVLKAQPRQRISNIYISIYLLILPLTLEDIIGRDACQARILVEIRTDKRCE